MLGLEAAMMKECSTVPQVVSAWDEQWLVLLRAIGGCHVVVLGLQLDEMLALEKEFLILELLVFGGRRLN